MVWASGWDAFRMFMFMVFWVCWTGRRLCSAPELAGGTIQCIPSGLEVPFGPPGEMLPKRVLLWKRDVWNFRNDNNVNGWLLFSSSPLFPLNILINNPGLHSLLLADSFSIWMCYNDLHPKTINIAKPFKHCQHWQQSRTKDASARPPLGGPHWSAKVKCI